MAKKSKKQSKKKAKKPIAKKAKKKTVKKAAKKSAKKSSPKKKTVKRKKPVTVGDKISGAYHAVIDSITGTDALRNKMSKTGASESE
jgi:RNA polymerase primary sigma factor